MEGQPLVYMDNAATFTVYPEVVQAMIPSLYNHFGTSSLIYSIARKAKGAVGSAGRTVAPAPGATPGKNELIVRG